MDKITYLAELAEGLARWVPERERQDILRYYAEYFDEAGPGREGEVVAELGDPWALSCRLAVEGGYVSQEAANSWVPPRKRTKVWPFVLAGTIACVAIAAVSVGMLASQFAGRSVSGEAQVAVGSVVENYGFAPVEEFPGAFAYQEGEEVHINGFWNMEDGWLEPFNSIDCSIELGSITVTEGNDFTLSINGTGSFVKWYVEDSTLKIQETDDPAYITMLTGLAASGGEGPSVDITVPEGVPLEKISIKTELGDVYVASVIAEKITLESQAGDVQCYEVRHTQKLELTADVGDIALGLGELWEGLEMDLEADVGQVEVNLNCWQEECSFELESDMGNILINDTYFGQKAEQKGSQPYKLNVETDAGDIHVCFYTGQKG